MFFPSVSRNGGEIGKSNSQAFCQRYTMDEVTLINTELIMMSCKGLKIGTMPSM